MRLILCLGFLETFKEQARSFHLPWGASKAFETPAGASFVGAPFKEARISIAPGGLLLLNRQRPPAGPVRLFLGKTPGEELLPRRSQLPGGLWLSAAALRKSGRFKCFSVDVGVGQTPP